MERGRAYELGPDGLAIGNKPFKGRGGALGALGMMGALKTDRVGGRRYGLMKRRSDSLANGS